MAIALVILLALIPLILWLYCKGMAEIDEDLQRENEYWDNHHKH
jgi:hypothetical protein